MNRVKKAVCIMLLLLTTGCFDGAELTERAFIMGQALDENEDGEVILTTQIYKPIAAGQQGGGGQGGQSVQNQNQVNIRTTGATVFEAVRDLPLQVGRRPEASHLRIILLSEDLVKRRGLYDILEIFYRDEDIRLTSPVLLVRGKASDYLSIKPLMEFTTSQQLLVNERSSARISQKTMDMNLLRLLLQNRSEVGNSVLPIVTMQKHDQEVTPSVAGVALLEKGKMVGTLSPTLMESLQMLIDEYENGSVEVPCQAHPKKSESVNVLSLQSSLKPMIHGETLKVNASVKLGLAIEEVICSKIKNPEAEKKFVEWIEKQIEEDLQETIAWLQKKQFDAIGLGNQINAKNPTLWSRWKPNWKQRFANTQFEFDVQARVIHSGTTTGEPVFSK